MNIKWNIACSINFVESVNNLYQLASVWFLRGKIISIWELFEIILYCTITLLWWKRNQSWLKVGRKAHTKTIWFLNFAIDIGIVCFKMLNIFMRPIARSTWMQRDATFLPLSTSLAGNWVRPSKNGGRFNLILSTCLSPWNLCRPWWICQVFLWMFQGNRMYG